MQCMGHTEVPLHFKLHCKAMLDKGSKDGGYTKEEMFRYQACLDVSAWI